MHISLFSFFSGIGFLDLGFEDENYDIVYVNENHLPFLKAYQHSRTKLVLKPPKYGYFNGSIEELLSGASRQQLKQHISYLRNHGEIIGFIGGPPCPDFSVGGKNKGKEGQNGRLSAIYVELISSMKPDFFLFENVKGLWKTHKHREFYNDMKFNLQTGGYSVTEKLINSIEYGAPQDRERILLFGIATSIAQELKIPTDNNFSIRQSAFPWLKYAKYPGKKAFQYNWPTRNEFNIDSHVQMPSGIPLDLTIQHWFNQNDVLNHPNTQSFFKPRAGIVRFLSVDEGDDSKKCFKRLHRWRYSPTAAYGNNEVHLHPYKPRRISIAEALAIQSLPKAFELPDNMSLTDMFKGVGNGVPFLAAKMIARSIREVLQNDN